jgi:hypothetical protein
MIKPLALTAAALLLYAGTRPETFRVERSITVTAPAGTVLPLIDDFHQWARWSLWEKTGPAIRRTYSDAASGKGAGYE